MSKVRFGYLFALVLTFNSLAEQPAGIGADDLKTFKFYDPQALLEPPEKPFAETSDRLGGWGAKPILVPPGVDEYYPMRVGPGPQDFMPVQGKTVGDYVFSGDMILGLARDLRPVPADPKKFRLTIMGKNAGFGLKKDSGSLWPHGLIPVYLDLPREIQSIMRTAMEEWNSKTNIKFIDGLRLTEDQLNDLQALQDKKQIGKWVWVTTQSDGGEWCNSYVGMAKPQDKDGKPYINLNGKVEMHCKDPQGAAIHELGHVIGLFHEHQRADRDEYVSVRWSGESYDIERDGDRDTYGTKFDTKSVMIYDHVIDLVSKKEVGDNQTLSAGDIKTVNRMYPKRAKGVEDLKELFENLPRSGGPSVDDITKPQQPKSTQGPI